MARCTHSALLVRWNKDLSLSVYAASGGKCLLKTKIDHTHIVPGDKVWLEAVAPFCRGWFCTDDRKQWRVRCEIAK